MEIKQEYDVAIAGGGLAGLATAIQLSRAGYSVAVFEKEDYPSHKVCGEYVGMESRDFLIQLGLPLDQMDLPLIDTLYLTAPNGLIFSTHLPQGGFGLSRYRLDALLAEKAVEQGVHLFPLTKVTDIDYDESFHVRFRSSWGSGQTSAKACCAAYGKRSTLDLKWNRAFVRKKNKRLDNFIGIKYHIRTEWEKNVIGLHNFENGYCGISRIEEDKYCLCYMTRAENLNRSGNQIRRMEEKYLYPNPHLRKIFEESEVIDDFPITISQLTFNKKSQVENGVLMLGDAAGMITPLCGNGMSIALHTGKIAAGLLDDFLQGRISRSQLARSYSEEWDRHFSLRFRAGRILQGFFGSVLWTHFFVRSMRLFPFLARPIIKLTHGRPY